MKKECLFYDEKKYIIVEGNKISYKNYNICKNAVIDYIKQIKKLKNWGERLTRIMRIILQLLSKTKWK